MNRTTEKIAVVALDKGYRIFDHGVPNIPSDVAAVLTLLPNQVDNVISCGTIYANALVNVIATPEGKVIDIRFDHQSIGFLAVRNYCLTSGATPPVMLQAFDDIEDPELRRIIDNEGVYLLPLLGEVT